MDPWDFKGGDKTTHEIEKKQYKQIRSTRYAIHESTSHFFVDDNEHPYNEDKPFDWVRGYHVGGKSLMWARQVYRLSEFDFEANAKEGIAIDWPIRYKDLAPWYSFASSSDVVSGFSQITLKPFSKSFLAIGKCKKFGVKTETASILSDSGLAASSLINFSKFS